MASDDGTTLTSAGATRSNLYLKAVNNTYYGQLAFTNGTNASSGGISYNNANQYMQFETATSEWMRLMSDGKLGIGTTSPESVLTVQKSTVAGRGGEISIVNNAAPTVGNDAALNFATESSTYGADAGNFQIKAYLTNVNGATDAIFTSWTGTAFTEKMRITSGGNVGIGTSSPASKLHLYDGTNPLSLKIQRTTVPVYLSDVQTAGTTAASSWSHNVENTSNGSLTWGSFANTSYAGSAIMLNADTSNSYITFLTASAVNTVPTERMRITGGGSLLIGTTSDSARLTITAATAAAAMRIDADSGQNAISIGGTGIVSVDYPGDSGGRFKVADSGQIYMFRIAAGAGTYAVKFNSSSGEITKDTSSIKYKNNIRDSKYGLSDVLKLRSAMFEYKDSGRTDVGLIAEEVFEIIPELTVIDKEGLPDGVSYDRFISVLVKAIQELSKQNEELSNRLIKLENK
jgi:hypothetical protein